MMRRPFPSANRCASDLRQFFFADLVIQWQTSYLLAMMKILSAELSARSGFCGPDDLVGTELPAEPGWHSPAAKETFMIPKRSDIMMAMRRTSLSSR